MKHEFDEVYDRRITPTYKWDLLSSVFGADDVLPLWVADMDFLSPAGVQDALVQRAEHGIFGYGALGALWSEPIRAWLTRRHGWETDKEWHVFSPGVVTTLGMAIQTFTQPGDRVLIQSPVYPPFAGMIKQNHRELVESELLRVDGRYVMDFDDLERQMQAGVRLMLLCSPHNPVGRVWTAQELQQLGDLCDRYQVQLVSDEIHADFVYKGHTYVPMASLQGEFAAKVITCIAPSKSFNIAGLHFSSVIIRDRDTRETFRRAMQALSLTGPSILDYTAAEAACRTGDVWMDDLLVYLAENRDAVIEVIRARIPEIDVVVPEGTYLLWLDLRSICRDEEDVKRFLVEEAKVALNFGHTFGKGGQGFARLNFGSPRSVVMQGIAQIESAVQRRRGL